jgi:transcription antitermination protein NusB
MKSSTDPRHLKRIKLFKKLFSLSFSEDETVSDLVKPIVDKFKDIDKLIVTSAPDWPIEKLNKVDLAILRLAIYELVFIKVSPQKVIIDEAIELAKHFGTEKTPKFVNGVLGSIIKKT